MSERMRTNEVTRHRVAGVDDGEEDPGVWAQAEEGGAGQAGDVVVAGDERHGGLLMLGSSERVYVCEVDCLGVGGLRHSRDNRALLYVLVDGGVVCRVCARPSVAFKFPLCRETVEATEVWRLSG